MKKLKLKTTYHLPMHFESITNDDQYIYFHKQNKINQYNHHFNKLCSIELQQDYYKIKCHNNQFIALHKNRNAITIYNKTFDIVHDICLKHITIKHGLIYDCTMHKQYLLLSMHHTLIKIDINNTTCYQTLPYYSDYPYMASLKIENYYATLVNTLCDSYLVTKDLCNHQDYILNKLYIDYTTINDHHYFIKQCCNETIIDIYCFKDCIKQKDYDDYKDCNKKVIQSIANVENSLANILQSESNKIQKAIDDNVEIDKLLEVNHSVYETIENVTQLENILLTKLKHASK